ncbi:MAG: glycine cleavage system protein H [Anaerolineales bacterium]|nr:glycine cleavage system protein H [Anaerolineales bacterium]
MLINARYSFPAELYYDRSAHVWARPDGDAVTIGLDVLGLESLGDIAYLSLHAIGVPVRRGEAMGSVEAAKMVGDLIAPVSGLIATHNEAVLRDPGLINRDPYGEGWIARLIPSDWARESAALVHGIDLGPWVEAEIERYRAQGWID